MPKNRVFFEKNPMSLGDVGLNRRPATVFIRNSTSFFFDHKHNKRLRIDIYRQIRDKFVNDKGVAHFINPSELFTQSLKTSPMSPF